MLIIALGVLALMAILGAAFASLMRIERRATENYVDAKRMDLLLDSAVDRVVAQLQGAQNFMGFTDYKITPWLFMLNTEKDLAHGRTDLTDNRVGAWEVFAELAGMKYDYKTKVIDCSAQINLNGRQDTLARILDNLGRAIEQSERLKRDGKHYRNPLHEKPLGQGSQVTGLHIIQLRRRLPENRFSSKEQISQLIGPENFEILKDFITVHSWEDPDTYMPSDGLNEVPELVGTTTTSGGGQAIGGGIGMQRQPSAYSAAARVDAEPHYPININTAPEEVLIAVLQGLAGRRLFPFSKLAGGGGSIVQVDQNAMILGERLMGVNEEYMDVTPRAVFVYTGRFEYEQAKKLADQIVRQRKQWPFMTWRTNIPQQPGFEDFIDALDTGYFPPPDRCEVIDPDQPMNTQIRAMIMMAGGGGINPVNRLWVKGHDTRERQMRRQFSLPMHENFAWYYEAVKGVVKANFNPNTRINRYNPNAPAYVCVDKSDLVWWDRSRNTLYKGYTTEFCFDTNGIYEVTTRGRLSSRVAGAAQGRTAVGTQEVFSRPNYEKEMRTVVEVFRVMRHTTQFQFEKAFQSISRSSKNDRKFVVTYPDPMAALTELVTSGSKRDGRVELAGLNDGNRLQAPVNQRLNLFTNLPDAITMAIGFQDRSADSVSKLKRARSGSGNSLASSEYIEAIAEIFDANVSKSLQGGRNREHLALAEMRQLMVFKNPDATVRDPLINKEVLGTDVFPDGFHMGISRTSHLDARTVWLPARRRIGDTMGGTGNTLVGESGIGSRANNRMGNVPYNRGGIAFWVKFEFNGDDPVFCGLIGCTEVITQVTQNASDYKGSEGTQFFIFKNSLGQLRIVRMYYHQAFMEAVSAGDSSGSDASNSINLFPDPGVANAGGAANVQNPILAELDPQKIVSRSDIVVDVNHFRAHEWHHVAVDWDDQNAVYPIRLYLDFQELKEGALPRRPQLTVDGTANSWVRLNERQPKDGLQIGSIIREQGVMDAGLFKWFTNTAIGDTGVGIRPVARSVKRILANATIDELISYEGTFSGVKQFYGAGASPGYFTVREGEYANVFELPLPSDVDHVVLRSFDWTSYYPTTYTDSRVNSVPQPLQNSQAIRVELTFDSRGTSTNPAPFDEPWRRPTVTNVAGRKAFSRVGDVIRQQKAEVVYKFTIAGARANVGNAAGGVVGTPAIDDVTLTYFLPTPRILAQEEER